MLSRRVELEEFEGLGIGGLDHGGAIENQAWIWQRGDDAAHQFAAACRLRMRHMIGGALVSIPLPWPAYRHESETFEHLPRVMVSYDRIASTGSNFHKW